MNRVPFYIIDKEIEKMYDELMSSDDESKIDEIVKRIVKFLHNCGWSEKEYTDYMMGYDLMN